MSEVTRSETDEDIDLTDELPVLSESAIVAVGEREDKRAATGDHTIPVPFPKLERRREFEQRMASLEGRIGTRDAALGDLERRVGEIARGWEAVETQLGRNAAAIESIAEQFAGLRGELARAPAGPESDGAGRDAADIAEARAERDAAARARAEAEAELETLHRRLGDRETELEQSRAQLAEREAELQAATERAAASAEARDADDPRAELAALTDYITNRRAHWDALQARVDEQAQRIRELETELEQRVGRQHEAEELAARESARAVEYRNELARRAAHSPGGMPAAEIIAAGGGLEELEQALVDLRGTLDAQRDVLDAAGGAPETETADGVHERLAAAESELERARADLQRLDAALHERTRAADEHGDRVAALQNQLAAQVDRLSELQDAAGDTGADDAAAAAEAAHVLTAAAAEPAASEPADDVPERGALVCLTSDRPEHYSIAKREMLIGRSTEADIRIATHFVSREHARLRNDGRAVFIEDLGSTNGVFVNSIRVDSQELHDGDWVTIGETQFRYIANMP